MDSNHRPWDTVLPHDLHAATSTEAKNGRRILRSLSRLVVVVVLGSSAVVLTAPTAANSTSRALQGRIVFDDDGADVWSVNADGSNRRRLTSDPAPEFDPSWSPDGAKVAYRSEVMNIGGSGNSEIYVMNADGSEPVNVTDNPAQDYSPAWSPDGRKIAFASDRGGVYNDVYVMNADGTDVRRVTRHVSVDEYPSWSPNGRKIAFQSDRDGHWEIYIINVDGTGEHRVTRKGGKLPSWSPGGQWIAYQGPNGRAIGDRSMASLWLVRSDGRRARRIIRGGTYTPSWAPDGRGILIARRGLQLVDLKGRVRGHITSGPALNAQWLG